MAINTPNLAYQRMRPAWDLSDALWGDTPAMRAARTAYLPARPGEYEEDGHTTNSSYETRLNETTLVNYFAPAVRGLSGKVFQKPIIIGENISAEQDWWNDIDLAGNNINDFAMQVFESGERRGVSYILVDAPSDSGSTTLADQIAANERPYLTFVDAKQVIGWEEERIDNVQVLTSVRIAEVVIETDDDYEQTPVEQIRKISKNFNEDGSEAQGCTWEIYQEVDDKWEVVEQGQISLDYIPLVPFYTNRTGFMEAETYFTTLCYLNLQHWQSSSYQTQILNTAREPRLLATGFETDEIIAFQSHGVKRGVFSTKPDAKAEWIECKGASIAHGERDLERLKDEMALLALDPALRKAVNTSMSGTATQAAIEHGKSASVLQQWAESLQRSLQSAIAIMYEMSGKGEIAPELTVNDDFKIVGDVEKVGKLLIELSGMEKLTDESLLKEVKRLGAFDDDFDVLEEVQAIKDQVGLSEFGGEDE